MQSHSQYYLRGVVKDENGQAVYNAKIFLASKGTVPFYTGSSGAFGIPIAKPTDSITIAAEGFEVLKTLADAKKYDTYTLKFLAANATLAKHKLSTMLPENADDISEIYNHQGETYTNLIENEFIPAAQNPETGFALNVNRASYSNIRRFLNNNMEVPPDAVRIEEMLNYFDISGKLNADRNNFSCFTRVTTCPWNANSRLLFIQLKAPYINIDSTPPANLVFLIDVSGSMDHPSRLPLLKDAFKMLVNNLRDKDTVAVVIYGGIVGTFLQPISCAYKDSIIKTIEKLEASGETPGAAAIQTAYTLAERMYNKNATNRIILATDGDFNVGQTTDKELEDLILAHQQSGIYLTCLGVGMGNYKDSKLEILAKKGNGNFAYIDNIYEAEKVLIAEFTKTIYAVASDAYVRVYFNPYYVKKYRLIGFDNKKELLEKGNTELEGGEVGSGHSLMAVFEIDPGSIGDDSTIHNNPDINIARLQLHYKVPETGKEVAVTFPAPNNFKEFKTCDSSFQFITSVIMFGGLLKQSDLWQNFTWDDILKIARSSAELNNYAQKEFLVLVAKTKKIYEPYRKKKKKKPGEE
jgi:Ca-activated chloride channel homolog